jgi:hypothetical protein
MSSIGKSVAGCLGVLASIATIIGLLVALNVISPFPKSNLTPTAEASNSTPSSASHLSSSYSGTLTRSDRATYTLRMSNVQEDDQGHFTASGRLNDCSMAFDGNVRSDNMVSFAANPSQGAGSDDCEQTTFKGQLASDGSMSGEWNGQTQGMSGSWNAS